MMEAVQKVIDEIEADIQKFQAEQDAEGSSQAEQDAEGSSNY